MIRKLIAALLAAFLLSAGGAFAETENGQEQEQPFLSQITQDDPAAAYVLVQARNAYGLLPLPMEGEYRKTVRQELSDGSEWVNILHVTAEGFWMEEANCEGQDCVGEGEVTLANREERILGNAVICLPHGLTIYLLTREEAEQLFR